MIRRIVMPALLLAALTAPHAFGQEWARKMFQETTHDFGSVARGAKAEYRFVLQNLYKEEVHIAGVRSSCGCTSAEVPTQTLKTWEEGEIVANFNTRSFLGQRSATITVTIDRPYYAEVQLNVSGYIRSDVVFEPGVVNLGELDQGAGGETRVRVNYAGRSDWEIVDVRSANPHFEVELNETQRKAGSVGYEMLVRLKPDAPAGYVNDQLMLVTNDGARQSIPLSVEGRVRSALTVSPAPLILGVLAPGETVTKKLLVRGKTAFRILNVVCDDEGCFEVEFDPERSSTTHFVPITFAADAAGKLEQTIRIETDLGAGVTAEVLATADVK